ncbi:MAG: response regulator transcription factor [Ignavibacteriales bacterium]|nr:response regulator transcription factor [Ignavibacteriales bacterium]
MRVAIIEDHDDFREGLYHILEGTEGFHCVGRYASVEQAMKSLPKADVYLMDIGLPGKSGIEGAKLIKSQYPDAQVIMLTVFEDDKSIFQAVAYGANGYLLKSASPVKILNAIEEAVTGGMPMTPLVARKVVEMFKRHMPQPREKIALTEREKEILKLLVDGLNYSMIGEKLFISLDTVRNHIRHIYEKLHVHSKSHAVAKALKSNLV